MLRLGKHIRVRFHHFSPECGEKQQQLISINLLQETRSSFAHCIRRKFLLVERQTSHKKHLEFRFFVERRTTESLLIGIFRNVFSHFCFKSGLEGEGWSALMSLGGRTFYDEGFNGNNCWFRIISGLGFKSTAWSGSPTSCVTHWASLHVILLSGNHWSFYLMFAQH